TSRFVSMFYGELEKNGNFIYVNSGHPPPFHLDTQGVAHPLSNGGAVLGPIPNATYERGFVSLGPGELIIMYTDGILEARRPDSGPEEAMEEEFGRERLLAAVRAHRHKSSADIVAAVFESVETFCGVASQADDRTVLIVKLPDASG
ncbi:MAG: PP2C family protein-serine/threonine phosphatase, partial [Thermoanaerobaculia bacterium]